MQAQIKSTKTLKPNRIATRLCYNFYDKRMDFLTGFWIYESEFEIRLQNTYSKDNFFITASETSLFVELSINHGVGSINVNQRYFCKIGCFRDQFKGNMQHKYDMSLKCTFNITVMTRALF